MAAMKEIVYIVVTTEGCKQVYKDKQSSFIPEVGDLVTFDDETFYKVKTRQYVFTCPNKLGVIIEEVNL